MKILIPEAIHARSLERLRAAHAVQFDPTLVNRRAELVEAARDADVLIVRNRTQVRDDLLEALAAAGCRAVGRLGVGLDNIDVDGCKARGIAVIPAIGANARSVAEYVMTCAMLLRRPGHYDNTEGVAAGRWPRTPSPSGHEIAGATLGLIGFGSIGRLTGQLGHLLGMRVIAHDPSPASAQAPDYDCRLVPLDELLATSDVVSLHLPYLPSTHHLIDAARLATMRADAVLINAARGGIVDEAALAQALRDGRLRGAALDVFEQEPLPAGSPLAGAPHLLLSAHIGGVTADSELRVCELVTDRILALLA